MHATPSAAPSLRSRIEALYAQQVSDFASCAEFKALEGGETSRADYDRFIENVGIGI